LRDHPLRAKRGNRFGKTQLFFFSFFDFFHAVDGTLKPKNQLSETAFFSFSFFFFSFFYDAPDPRTNSPIQLLILLSLSLSFFVLFI